MDNSSPSQSASSSYHSDPFRDPDLPSQTYQPEQVAPTDASYIPTSYEFLAPSDVNASQISGRDVSNLHRQEQSSNTSSSSQSVSDEILPVQPAYHATSYDVVPGTSLGGIAEPDHSRNANSTSALYDLVTRREVGKPVDRSPEIIRVGKRKISIAKWILITVLLAIK
jgi:hypothetical protein